MPTPLRYPFLSDLTITAIQAEVLRSYSLHSNHAMINPSIPGGTLERLAILGEEFGEVCKALTYDGMNGGTPTKEEFVKEAIQLAAMAAAMAQVVDENGF